MSTNGKCIRERVYETNMCNNNIKYKIFSKIYIFLRLFPRLNRNFVFCCCACCCCCCRCWLACLPGALYSFCSIFIEWNYVEFFISLLYWHGQRVGKIDWRVFKKPFYIIKYIYYTIAICFLVIVLRILFFSSSSCDNSLCSIFVAVFICLVCAVYKFNWRLVCTFMDIIFFILLFKINT